MTSQAEQISYRDNTQNRLESQNQNDGLAQARVFDLTELRNAVNAAGHDDLKMPPGFPNDELIIGFSELPKQPGNKQKDDTGSGDAHRNEGYEGDENKIEGMKPPMDFELHFPHQRLDLPKAIAKLDALIDPNLSSRDQSIMRDLNEAVITGDSRALADTSLKFKGNPEELQRFSRMLNENLQGANAGIAVTTEGNSLLIFGARNRAVEISMDGRASVRELKHLRDGTVKVGDHIHTESPAITMNVIGAQARSHMALSELTRVPKTPYWGEDIRPTR